MKNRFLRMTCLVLLASLLFSACSPGARAAEATQTAAADLTATAALQASPTSTATPEPSPTNTVVRATPRSMDTPTPEPTRTAIPTATPEDLPDSSAVISFDYAPIPLGKELLATVNGRKVAIRVNSVTTGSRADQIALTPAPEEMEWAIVQLVIRYIEGEKGARVQLLETSMFDGISNGDQGVGNPFLTYTPSPHLEDVTLLPGEQSLAYLAFQVYKDDLSPMLRFTAGGESHFFALTSVLARPAQATAEVQLTLEDGAGTRERPVPAGEPGYVAYGGTVYKITIEKTLRGFNALKKIKDSFGINDDPPEGQEFLMPFVSVTAVRTAEEDNHFSLGGLTSFSNATLLDKPLNVLCSLPCLQSTTLYPNGTTAGWVALYAYQDDPDPLMVFGGSVYFEAINKQDTATAFMRNLSADAIGYPNRNNITPLLELAQVGPVNAIAFTPDDQKVITAGDDKIIHIWDTATGKEITTFKGHLGSIKDIAFSNGGGLLASISITGEVIVWNMVTGDKVQAFDLKSPGLAVKFLPDGTLLGVTTGGLMQIWDTETWQPVRREFVPRSMNATCANAAVQSFDASDDGQILAASLSCGFGAIWELGSTKVLYADSNQQAELALRSRSLPTSGRIALSPDGEMAAFGMVYYPARRLMVLDILDVENQTVIAGVNPINLDLVAAKIAPNKDLILAGVGSQIMIWWPEAYVWRGQNLIQLTEHKVIVTALEFSTNGEILASGDYSGRTILWTAK